MAEDEHILLWTIHHTLFDGWSLDIFVRELNTIYGALAVEKPSPLKELALQYADYAAWQQRTLESDALKRQLVYWKKQLGGRLPVMDLPFDRPRPQNQKYSGARQTLVLPAALASDLKLLAQSENTSLFTLLVTALGILLQKLTSQEDVVIGAPTAGRTRAEVEGLIGCFVNTLVLRNNLSGDPDVRVALRRAKDVVLNAQAHQDVPFEVLVRELQPKRDLSRTPLFQVFFNMLNLPEGIATPECPIAIERASLVEVAEAKFDLSLYAREQRDGINITAIYNADLFENQTVVRMLEQFRLISEAMAGNPNARLSELLMNVAPQPEKIDSFNSVIAE
jgi:hypothetical protein